MRDAYDLDIPNEAQEPVTIPGHKDSVKSDLESKAVLKKIEAQIQQLVTHTHSNQHIKYWFASTILSSIDPHQSAKWTNRSYYPYRNTKQTLLELISNQKFKQLGRVAIATLSKWKYNKEVLGDIGRLKEEIKTRLWNIIKIQLEENPHFFVSKVIMFLF